MKILQYAGVTIREPEVFGFAAGEETKEKRRIMAYINQFQYYENKNLKEQLRFLSVRFPVRYCQQLC